MPPHVAKAAQVEDTKFSSDRGYYSEPVSVAISTRTPGADIFYTLDGSVPTTTRGIRYQGPVPISSTTVLRAAAFEDGMQATNVDTMTYLFPLHVLKQSGAGLPKTWGRRNGIPVVADYAMDREITDSTLYRDRLLSGLESLPTVSIVLDQTDWLDPQHGIYANPTERGAAWERPASMEIIFPHGANDRLQAEEKSFQIDCGLRVHGGWNRRPEEGPKHSLRLLFKKKYGKGRLKQPLFPASASPPEFDGKQKDMKSFNTLILRSGNNNSWLHRGADERVRSDYLRDQWMRDTFAAMGHVSARGRFVHLFINGLY